MKNLRIEDLSTEQKVGMLLCARSFRTEDDIEFTVELIRNHALGCVQVPVFKPEIMARVKEAADYPILIITDVEIILRIILCAVPAFILVDPVITSAPVSGWIAISEIFSMGVFSLDVNAIVKAPFSLAFVKAPIT